MIGSKTWTNDSYTVVPSKAGYTFSPALLTTGSVPASGLTGPRRSVSAPGTAMLAV